MLGNVAMFLPVGWLAATLLLYQPSVRVVTGARGALVGMLLSLAIEVAQYFLGRPGR